MAKKAYQNNPKVLGLDVSTKTIGWALFDMRTQELLELTQQVLIILMKILLQFI